MQTRSYQQYSKIMPLLLSSVLAGPAVLAASNSAIPIVQGVGKPLFSSEGGGVAPLPNARTIPHFSFASTDPSNGQTYTLTMVGADPSSGLTSTIPTEIIPIRLRFANGGILDGGNRAAAVLASPVFSDYQYSAEMTGGDIGQYGDVFMRAQFKKAGSGYHVKLAKPLVLPTVTIDVPKNQGLAVAVNGTILAGLVDIQWFSARLQNLMGQLQIDPATLPVFLTDNAMAYETTVDNCCVIGYHGSHSTTGLGSPGSKSKGVLPMQTFIYAAYTTPGTFGDGDGLGVQDIHALSHEVSEWLDDPFVDNAVQPWLTPTAPQYGCTPVLETGDPVVGIWFPLPGNLDVGPFNPSGLWHPEDEVFWPWFLRQTPSTSFGGHYTFMGPGNPFPGFAVPATGCN